jgi:hypothetical protein
MLNTIAPISPAEMQQITSNLFADLNLKKAVKGPYDLARSKIHSYMAMLPRSEHPAELKKYLGEAFAAQLVLIDELEKAGAPAPTSVLSFNCCCSIATGMNWQQSNGLYFSQHVATRGNDHGLRMGGYFTRSKEGAHNVVPLTQGLQGLKQSLVQLN